MKKVVIFSLSFFMLQSCDFFETKKISSETFYQEEMKLISWNDIDNYPLFKPCETLSEKTQQKSCFENTVATILTHNLQLDSIKVAQDIQSTIQVQFMISNKGVLSIDHIKIDSLTQNTLPFLEHKILQSLDSIQLIAPAYKRGIPVETSFILPIVINTNHE